MSFVHLHVHTEYSLLDGSNKIKEYVARVKELGMNSAAIRTTGVPVDRSIKSKKAGTIRSLAGKYMSSRYPGLTGRQDIMMTGITISFCWLKMMKAITI